MLFLLIGCKTEVPDGQDFFYNVEMEANSYPKIEDAEALKNFLNDNTEHIIDKVTHVIDATMFEMIWECV